MTAENTKKLYLVGIEYDCPHERGGYFDFKRNATLKEIAGEVLGIMRNGHSFPAFPPSANPQLMFAFILEPEKEIDCLAELSNIIKEMV